MTDHGRVRVAVRSRPRNAEELILDADFNDCVELFPEVNFFSFLFPYVLRAEIRTHMCVMFYVYD
jgi:hypothetical protein